MLIVLARGVQAASWWAVRAAVVLRAQTLRLDPSLLQVLRGSICGTVSIGARVSISCRCERGLLDSQTVTCAGHPNA